MNADVVLLHGFTGAPSSWDAVRRELPGSAIALAMLGHAGEPDAASAWDDEIDRIAERVRSIGARPHLVGYSMGGRIALGVLTRHPGLVARATLIGAGAGLEDAAIRASRRHDDEAHAADLERDGIASFVDAWEREPIFATQRALPETVRAAHRAIRLSHSAIGLAASLRTVGQGAMPSLWNELPRLDVPITLIAGSDDPKLASITQRMAERLPRARHVLVPGAGHDVVLERPSELARLLAREEPA